MFRLLLLFLIPLQLFAFDVKKEFAKAEKGDFIVYSYKQSFVLVRIRKMQPPILEVEEITAPLTSCPSDWQAWLTNDAPGHVSWTISRINLESANVESIFSVDEKQFLNSNPTFQFLPTLIKQPLHPIRPSDRKYIGPKPLAGEQDFRKLWHPKIIFEKKQVFPPIKAYVMQWPDDETELSEKPIDVYFAESSAITYLPYWIEVAAGITKAKISALDSGKKLSSPVSLATYEQ